MPCMSRLSVAARERWARIIAEQRESGVSISAFCAERDIPLSSFFPWRRRPAQAATGETRVASSRFVEARVVDAQAGSSAAAEIAIALANGRRLVVGCGFDRILLLEVIEVLEASPRDAAGATV